MSMNLYVKGTRKATVVVKGKKKTIEDRTKFDLWQTPTKLTYEVLALPTLEQKVEAYGQVLHYITSLSKETLVVMLNNLDNYQRMLNRKFSDEEVT